ncbi:unnamed protein product [Clonostachys byssicola]|uniref:Uncharacterized protein n=1 Tax=Clonostachys byssicola TaxID=160290 RepID=A0A9N9UC36_9HYPO|nr:unnamed protein product [Clonostachys byssicola]
MASDTTIFGFLTYPNPTLDRGDETNVNKTNTVHHDYANPKWIAEWPEMQDLKVFREAFGGKLWEEAHREGRDLQRPRMYPSDNTVINEIQSTELFNKWNKQCVMEGLQPILETYRPLIWAHGQDVTGVTLSPPQPHPLKTREQPVRDCSPKSVYRRASLDRLRPDSSSIPSYPDPLRQEEPENFLKEYKVAAKWKSSWIKEKQVVNESGLWLFSTNSTTWPIKQAFTYCLKYSCRYACILTSEELFLFRVRPMGKEPSTANPTLLRRRMQHNALLEYVSIPWSNHCQGEPKAYNEWTINLALWFMHVAAGHSSRIQWSYPPLVEETALPLKHLRLQGQALSPVEEDAGDHSGECTEDSSLLSGAQFSSPPGEILSKDSEKDGQDTIQFKGEIILVSKGETIYISKGKVIHISKS